LLVARVTVDRCGTPPRFSRRRISPHTSIRKANSGSCLASLSAFVFFLDFADGPILHRDEKPTFPVQITPAFAAEHMTSKLHEITDEEFDTITAGGMPGRDPNSTSARLRVDGNAMRPLAIVRDHLSNCARPR
jgi:hypothetical protein